MPEIGQAYTFHASYSERWRAPDGSYMEDHHTGRITYINHDHRFFLVEAVVGRMRIRECFKF